MLQAFVEDKYIHNSVFISVTAWH